MVEEEQKYEVDDAYVLPDLTGAAPAGGRVRVLPPVTLVARYLDTVDLRLARAGASLRHRRGDELPWTVKLPTGTPGVRHEVSRPGPKGQPPPELVELVTVLHRGAPLAPVTVVRTVRHAYEVCDRAGAVLAEVVDDRVTVLDEAGTTTGAFRELEVERKAGDRALLDRLGAVLREAGAQSGTFTPKHVRALGASAQADPDLVAPAGLTAEPSAGEVVTESIRKEIHRLLAHDPLVRLRAPAGGGDSGVHQMRVACRRLRSDLRTFKSLIRKTWSRPLRDELRWLAGVLGAARDAEVLRKRLRDTASADPLSPLDQGAVDRLDEVLAQRQRQALAAIDKALRSPRYLALVDALVLAARAPRLTRGAAAPAAEALPALVARPWRRLTGPDGVDGLDAQSPDGRWHAVRKEGKQTRYAVNAVAPTVGKGARRLSRALAGVQDVLGEHQDAAVAADTWLEIAAERPDDHELAVTAGRLAERERLSVRRMRALFPAAWHGATRRRRTSWLP
ncbi:CYTH and CHAD domain-containing protein [Micromonospora sp. NPDC049047]|uniref:CYTH and CHAD domain-containing protein n=1 Tax=Micromonospora sp. NPDC049047 TaxID=3155645 RepID=UPI0033E4C167